MMDKTTTNRRSFLASIAAVSSLGAVNPAQRNGSSPWAARADELWDTDGAWSDFAAWREWAKARWTLTDFGELTGTQEIDVYALCCDAIKQLPRRL
jgi:hypothetical protein